jgi:hypothetical protein
LARGGGVRLATKGLGIAYGFVGFIGGLVLDYFGRLLNPADRLSTNISTMDMIELGGCALSSLIGYISPGHGEWVPLSAGLVNGKLYATVFGPRLFGNRYILTSINSAGQLTSGAGYLDETGYFGGGYQTGGLVAEAGTQFANLGPVGDPDATVPYGYEGEEYYGAEGEIEPV